MEKETRSANTRDQPAEGARPLLERKVSYKFLGCYMFHAHQSEFTELGWMGFFDVVE